MLTDIYRKQEETLNADGFEVLLLWNGAHEVYQGHFPNQPVTPGVVLMDACLEEIKKHTQINYVIAEAKTMKFMQMVLPEQELKITFKNTKDTDWTCLGFLGDQKAFKFNISLSEI